MKREWHSVLGVVYWQVCEREYVTHARLMAALNQARLGILDLTGLCFGSFRWSVGCAR